MPIQRRFKFCFQDPQGVHSKYISVSSCSSYEDISSSSACSALGECSSFPLRRQWPKIYVFYRVNSCISADTMLMAGDGCSDFQRFTSGGGNIFIKDGDKIVGMKY